MLRLATEEQQAMFWEGTAGCAHSSSQRTNWCWAHSSRRVRGAARARTRHHGGRPRAASGRRSEPTSPPSGAGAAPRFGCVGRPAGPSGCARPVAMPRASGAGRQRRAPPVAAARRGRRRAGGRRQRAAPRHVSGPACRAPPAKQRAALVPPCSYPYPGPLPVPLQRGARSGGPAAAAAAGG